LYKYYTTIFEKNQIFTSQLTHWTLCEYKWRRKNTSVFKSARCKQKFSTQAGAIVETSVVNHLILADGFC
jgi:hypothetical protein